MNAHMGGVAAKPKFEVGDRVSLHDFPYILYENQRAGTVVRKRNDGKYEVEIDNYGGDTLGFFESWMAPLAPTFAVGDRIQPKRNIGDFFTVGRTYTIARDTDGGFVLTDNEQTKIESAKHYTDIAWLTENFVKASPLRIEPGKYYRTRDGRRALVSRNEGDSVYPFYHEVDGRGWHGIDATGKSCIGSDVDDLIAEAPATAKANPAAQVDNLADEYGGGKGEREPKFKVSDRVRLINNGAMAAKVGATATVTAIDRWLRVKWDRNDLSGTQSDGGYCPDSFELAHPATLIVALIENGQPRPATHPYIHRSREAATAEADRLAGKHKGQEFGVFELVDTRKVDKPVYEHEWQRLAAEGRVSLAVDALVKLTSLPREAALRAIRLAA